MTRLRSAVVWVLVGAGSAALSYPGIAYGSGALRQARLAAEVRTIVGTPAWTAREAGPLGAVQGRHLRGRAVGADRGSGRVARTAAHPAPAPVAGQALGLLRIPAIGLEAVFLEGVSDEVLRVGPGHLPGTVLPGGRGVTVLAAHRDAHFRRLKDVMPGDRVSLAMPAGSVAYRVVGRRIADPDEAWVTRPRPDSVLRLVTCWPPAWIGPAPQRLVVSAVPVRTGRPGRTGPRRWTGRPERAGPRRLTGRPQRAGGEARRVDVRLVASQPAHGVQGGASTPAGTAGAAVALTAAFGAIRTRRGLAWWFLPWSGGLGLAALALLASWAGLGLAAPI